MGDMNGDGKLDLLIASPEQRRLIVALGRGDGSFSPLIEYPLGVVMVSPRSVADVNGDGKLDLVAVLDGTAVVLLGNGDGTLAPPAACSAGLSAGTATVADLDGDGHPDLAVTEGAEGVAVLLGHGDGTFAPPVANPTGLATGGVAVADVNGDAAPDLVTQAYGNVYVLLNQGGGAFAPAVSYSLTASSFGALAVGDLNGDGSADVAVVEQTGYSPSTTYGVEVLFNHGDGTFAPPVTIPTGNASTMVEIADLNGDGKLDLVTDGVSVLMGHGDGTFAPSVEYHDSVFLGYLAVGDVNGDGELDLAGGYGGQGSVQVLLNRGDGTFPVVLGPPLALSGAPVAEADFDGDGKPDLAYASISRAGVLFGNGDGTFIDAELVATGAPLSPVAADIDGDGRPDLAFVDQAALLVYVMRNQGNRQFAAPAALPFSGLSSPLTAADVNGDGTIDFVAGANVLLNQGNGIFAAPIPLPFQFVAEEIVRDVNGDGKPDLVALLHTADLNVLLGHGDGTFDTPVPYATGTGIAQSAAVADVDVADVDGDGKLDIVTADAATNALSVLLGHGDGTFAPAVVYNGIPFDSPVVQTYWTAVSAGDLNGDGRPDLVFGVTVAPEPPPIGGGTWYPPVFLLSVLFNHGDGTFAPAILYPGYGAGGEGSIVVSDLNADGKLDIVTSSGPASVQVLLNGGCLH
jgi:hypothetical protein